ncbi:MAG: ABC transporter permease [Chromatiales bacterium]|nr:ABC transporter permease [Chromatiales bacterium]
MMPLLRSFIALRWIAVWQRNGRVWRKLAGPALLGNIGEPLLYLVALGFGLGALVGEVEGVDYLTFLASGFVCASVMNTASFEGIYSAYTCMAVQETWTAMLHTPLDVHDILIGEAMWAATKALLSALFIIIVAAFLGAVEGMLALAVLPVALLSGVTFAAMALVVTAVSRSYDFFLYYFTLLLTPMLLFSGVFFPVEGMPQWLQQLAQLLPLSHAIELVRPLMLGEIPQGIALHLLMLCGYGLLALLLAARLIQRRLHR